ncbi:MAG: hypothetical protein KGM60_10900 [Comamonadaceae bacterium]|nr:hypothetical protein [Comamonadaceae bacterium]
MPIYTVQGPDGKTYTVEGPAGASAEQVGQFVMSQQKPEPPAVSQAGQSLNQGLSDIPRQLGLTARYALEGPAQAAQVFTEPVAGLMRLAGMKPKPLGEIASGLADTIGLPRPQSAQERVVGDATRLLTGSGGMLGGARALAQLPGMVGTVGQGMAAAPLSQLTSAVGGGAMGGLSREGGGNEMQQAAAGLIGGVAGGLVPGAVNALGTAGRSLLNKGMSPQQMDVQISNVLQQSGVDYSQVPERARQALRAQVADALRAGQELDPAAVRRLADFQAVGVTPTRGMVTQDPVQITREMNLAKTGANAGDAGLHGLARVQNQNNARMIQVLNDQGAGRGDAFTAGQSAIHHIQARDDALNNAVSTLYGQARDTAGRSAPLNGADFATNASRALDEALLGGALPADVQSHLNRIAQGQVPFTVDYAEQLKTRIAALQRASNDGAQRMALGVVRKALDDTPLMAPGVATRHDLQPSPVLGQQSIDAFNQARAAARSRFAWQESGRPVTQALNGAQPDNFVKQFVINGTLDDAQNIASNAASAPVREAILAHLKEKALSGAADEVGKFSQSAYNKALNQLGERKLALFFAPAELQQLRTLGRVAALAQNQPVGSAVNNSNSGALLLGRGIDVLNQIPVLGPMAGPALQNIRIGVQQRAAQNVAPGLLAAQPKEPFARGLLAPALAFSGGLLAPPP